MHILQEKLLRLSESFPLGKMSLRKIGMLVDETSPQKIKHHLGQLARRGLISLDKQRGVLKKVVRGAVKNTKLTALPILGSADCGPATMFADQKIEGYLRVSTALIPPKRTLFAIRASGSSMNKAMIKGKSIESGDYVIIDGADRVPRNGDYVVSIIDDVANIKRYYEDRANNQIALMSESTKDYPPIYIHPRDFSRYMISGKVVQVIKKLKIK